MYYPFLRGKLYELLSLRELSDSEDLNSIIPIIEPVQDNYSALNKATEKLEENNNRYIFVYKPNVGDLTSPQYFEALIENIYRDANQIPGFILDGKNTQIISELIESLEPERIALIHYEKVADIQQFTAIMGQNNIINILHLDRLGPFIRRQFGDFQNVMLRDPFTAERRNADYENVDSQSLSDDHIYFASENYIGYSDFLTIGEDYSATGFAPYAVAIHLTYLENDNSCWVQHFVSESNFDQSDVAGKYMEAMNKLIDWVNNHPDLVTRTSALQELIQLHEESHYPGLGYLKKLSIKHHIEMINNYFNSH